MIMHVVIITQIFISFSEFHDTNCLNCMLKIVLQYKKRTLNSSQDWMLMIIGDDDVDEDDDDADDDSGDGDNDGDMVMMIVMCIISKVMVMHNCNHIHKY